MSNELTVDQFKRVLPKKLSKVVNQELIDKVNGTLSNPHTAEMLRDNILGYVSVLNDGKFKIDSYIDAVKYCSFKLMGDNNITAYTKTFPDRYQRLVAEGVCDKDINSYVTAYNKNKLVNLIMEQSLIPSHILNQDLYQKALNVQAELMLTAKSEKVRSDAANSLLTQLKQPETQKVQLDVGIKEDKTIDALRASTMELVAQQRAMLQSGAMHAQEVAHTKLVVDAEYEDVSDASGS